MRKATGFVLVMLLLSGSTPAYAASETIKAGSAISVSYPKTVKIKNGCQNIKISYKVGKLETNDFAAFSIYDDEDEIIAQKIIYYSPALAKSMGKPIFKKIGTTNIKVCRDGWEKVFSDGETESYRGFSKGSYQVELGTTTVVKYNYIKFN